MLSKTLGLTIGLVLCIVVLVSGYFLISKTKPVTYTEPINDIPVVTSTHRTIGTSVEGRAIEAYTFGSGDQHLLFVGGIHGGYEWNSVLLAYGMIDHFTEYPEAIPENIAVTIVPSANPDGMYAVVGKEGRFLAIEVPQATEVLGKGRFNARDVDLNRNFDCKWQPTSTWRGTEVSAGTTAFSEPESQAIQAIVREIDPVAVVFWHSQANAVYASECETGILPDTRILMNTYATASGYTPIDVFDQYAITGDAEGWLASVNIPAITVELATHESIEWSRNLAGVEALLAYYGD